MAQTQPHQNFSFRKFGGVNTRDQRFAIQDDQFAWLEGVLPIGDGNLSVVPGISSALATLPVGVTCNRMVSGNLNNVEYVFLFCTNGSAYQMRTDTNVLTNIATASTFTSGGTTTAQWNNTLLLIMDSANGMFSWDGTTLRNLSTAFSITASISTTTMTVTATSGYITVGSIISGSGVSANTIVTAQLTGTTGSTGTYTVSVSQSVASESMTSTPTVPTAGTSIATFAGRVWIGNNRTVSFSAPGQYTDFNTADAAGSFVISDSALRSTITAMTAANNYLYIFGTTSINVVSDVRVSSGVTLFSNTNISTAAGTGFKDAIVPYYRRIMFSAPYGFMELSGSSTQVLSSEIDVTYELIDQTKPITAGVASVYDKLCLFYMFQYVDPAGSRPLIATYLEKKWFFFTPPPNATLMCGGVSGGLPTLFVTNGSKIYNQFGSTTTAVSHTIKTKLFDMGSSLVDKQALKFGLERVAPAAISSVSFSIDTEAGTPVAYASASGNAMTWTNNSGGIITWLNNASVPIQWLASGYLFLKQNVENNGSYRKYIGATVTSSTAGGVYSGFHFQFEPRAIW